MAAGRSAGVLQAGLYGLRRPVVRLCWTRCGRVGLTTAPGLDGVRPYTERRVEVPRRSAAPPQCRQRREGGTRAFVRLRAVIRLANVV
ncbi:hypothetical protein MRX96_013272 [Rhipicephalus microplus]